VDGPYEEILNSEGNLHWPNHDRRLAASPAPLGPAFARSLVMGGNAAP